MDKAEYKIKLEEINALAERGDFQGAAKVASDIDWRHVRSVRTLCMIGEIYEACKRYDDSLAVLKLAYRRSSASKTVLYRLADLSIRQGDFDEAKRYANEFEQIAPNDSSRYILKYKMLRAQKAPLDDQIAVLQEYKDKEYTERWAYELAKLYRKNGQNEKCIEECDDMILWFSEGKYVKKAMELKMQLTQLTKQQKAKYDRMNRTASPEQKKDYASDGLDGISTVEKAVSEASESEEAVESLDHTTTDLRTQAEKAQAVKALDAAKAEPDKEKMPNKIADGIKSYISNIRSKEDTNKEEKTEDTAGTENAAASKPESTSGQQAGQTGAASAKPVIKELEPESAVASNSSVVQDTRPMPEIRPDEDAQGQTAAGEGEPHSFLQEKKQEKDEPLDLDKLFAETSSSLSNEIASGKFKLDDQLEGEKNAADNRRKTAAEKAGTPTKPAETVGQNTRDLLTGKETDESLGLTREFNFKDEVNREMNRRQGSSAPIPKPEDAARKKVLEAQGKLGRIETPAPKNNQDTTTFKKFGNDRAIQKELLADEGDLKDIPKEDSHEALMNLSNVSARNVEGSRDIIEHIMQEPAVFHKIPVEARRLDDREKQALSYLAEIPGVDFQVTSALADIHNNCGDKTSRSGNVVIMGRQGSGKTRLAKGIIAMVCQHLHLQAAKVAIIIADELNTKDPVKVVQKMAGGFLVIEAAGSLSDETIDKLNQAMGFRTDDLLVILEDEKHDMRSMLDAHPDFAARFTSQITVPVFTNDELVTFAKTYAKENKYKLDELATLALYTMIGDNQKDSEPVTVGAVKDMVDKAIDRHRRKHRFSKSEKTADGRIILKEKDFNF